MFPSSLDERADHFLVVVFDICAAVRRTRSSFLGEWVCRATLRCDSAALQKPSAQDKARSKTAVLAAGMQEDLASLREKLTVKDVSTLKSPQHRSRWTCCMPLKVLTSVSSIGLWHERVSAQGTNPAMLLCLKLGSL